MTAVIIMMHYVTSRKVAGSIPEELTAIFNWYILSSRTMALGLTRPLTEMSTVNLSGGQGWSARKTDNLIAICELIV
jgi:hypothetical protein